MEEIKQMDSWFVNLLALGGACYFLWSIKGILADMRLDIAELKSMFFSRTDAHEQRLSRLEGVCKTRRHGDCNIDND